MIFKKLDDEMHFWAGMMTSIFAFITMNFLFSQWLSAVFAFGIAAAVGIGKEYYDEKVKKTEFNERDLKWTVIGGSIVPLLFIITDIIYHYTKA